MLAILAWTLSPVSTPPAVAALATDTILVTNQWAGSTCTSYNERLFTFNVATRQLVNRGQPSVSDPTGAGRGLGEFVEAKPYDLNRKVAALWGGSGTQLAAIGIWSPIEARWTKGFALDDSFYTRDGKMPHSLAVLPPDPSTGREYFAVAQTGPIDGAGSGFVAVVDDTGTIVDKEPLASAHGVDWDGSRNNGAGYLFGVGWSKAVRYTYSPSTHQLTWSKDFPLPNEPLDPGGHNGAAGGHDIRRNRTDNDFFITADFRMWDFDPDTGVFTEILKNNARVGGVKSIDQRFEDGKTEYNLHKDSVAKFLGGYADVSWGDACIKPYKAGRWLYPPGEKVYPEDGGTNPQPTTSWSPTITVGGGANTWWIEIYTDSDVTSVEVNIRDGERYKALPKQSWGAFAASPPVEVFSGDNVKIIVRRSTDGATAASVTFDWLVNYNPATERGWVCSFTPGSGSSTSRVETWIDGSVGTNGYVEVRVGTSLWTRLTKQADGRWARDMTVPSGAAVLFRAVRDSDTAKAYSPIYYTWPPA